jgi:plasmid maintenance system antidote protein VapI
LTGRSGDVTIDTMAARNPISDVLRRAILKSGLPLLRIAEETGVERASLSRFVAGKRSLRLDMADKLAVYLGLALSRTGKKAKG